MVEPTHYFFLPFLEQKLQYPEHIEIVRVTLRVCGGASRLHLCQYEVLVCSKRLFDHHLVGSTEDWIDLL